MKANEKKKLAEKREQFGRVADFLYARNEDKFFEIISELDCQFDECWEFHEIVNSDLGPHNYVDKSDIEDAWWCLDEIAYVRDIKVYTKESYDEQLEKLRIIDSKKRSK